MCNLLASSINELNPEEKEAANWMLKNISNAEYLSFDDVRTGRVDLSGCKVMWWHLHIDGGIDNEAKFDAAAPSAVQTIAKVKEFYENGGSLLLTRFATYYAAKMGITKDSKIPNNCWGGTEQSGEITTSPWSFFVTDHQDHALYTGVNIETIDGKIVSSADRNTTIDLTLKCTYEYRIKHNPNASLDEIVEESRLHLINKFGKEGYAKEKMYFSDEEYDKFLGDMVTLTFNPSSFRKRYLKVNCLEEPILEQIK